MTINHKNHKMTINHKNIKMKINRKKISKMTIKPTNVNKSHKNTHNGV